MQSFMVAYQLLTMFLSITQFADIAIPFSFRIRTQRLERNVRHRDRREHSSRGSAIIVMQMPMISLRFREFLFDYVMIEWSTNNIVVL